MKVFWWETGIQIEPETKEETDALKTLWDSAQKESVFPSRKRKSGPGASTSGTCVENTSKLIVADK